MKDKYKLCVYMLVVTEAKWFIDMAAVILYRANNGKWAKTAST